MRVATGNSRVRRSLGHCPRDRFGHVGLGHQCFVSPWHEPDYQRSPRRCRITSLLGSPRRAAPVRGIGDLSRPAIARLLRVRAQRQPVLHRAFRPGARLDRIRSLAVLDPYSLHLGLAQETRDYVRAARELFIAARETTKMGVGRRNAESVAICFALRLTREPMVSARRSRT